MTAEADVATLKANMMTVQRDMNEIKSQVSNLDTKMDRVLSWMERREGAEEAIEKAQRDRKERSELSWTKVMGIAAAVGTAFAAFDWVIQHVFKVHLP